LKVRASVKPISKGDRLVIRRAGVRIKKGKIKGGKKVRRIVSSIPRNKQRQG
jgi:ribosomal protein L36